ncbi:nickel pincer cofactor biosynthesis protein LarB [Aedoeadaptatus coxii]|uniref:nickel pincer cofactor biosynthesis protein LarB n=1 Tax=Aedoeadaptatus coxii TaxID=755172 RepID=UPI002AD51EDD|nr:nickel pincer cofactor biosynthesis protein LarB [Peptoniphilus coxii]
MNTRSTNEFVTIDFERKKRRLFGETIFGESKTADHLKAAIEKMLEHDGEVLVTRLSEEQFNGLGEMKNLLDYDPLSKTAMAKKEKTAIGKVAVVTAGTSDVPVAEECVRTLNYFGIGTETVYDVGVAGIHRLFDKLDLLHQADSIVVCAGMDGALPSVVAGLVSSPVIAVPTSVGYGAAFGGVAPLLSMLNSCAEGVAVVNIDNGYGAAYMAGQMVMKIYGKTK